MEQVQAVATVTELVGKAFILRANGEKVALQQGDTLLPGTIIMTESGSQVVAQGPDFKLELEEDSLTEIPSQPLAESASNAPAILGTGSDEVAALQAAILDGLDPTQAFEAAAAGIPGAGALPDGTGGDGSGNGGFVTVARTGDALLANAGFDTAVAPLAFDEITEVPDDNLLADAPDGVIPAPIPPAPPITSAPTVTVDIGPAARGEVTINYKTVTDANGTTGNNGIIEETGFKITVKNDNGPTKFEEDDPYISVISPGQATNEPNISGFGVSGQPLGQRDAGLSDTINPEEITPEQTLTVTFDKPVSELTAQFSWLRDFEHAKYTIYDKDGNFLESGMLHGITDKIDPRFTIKAANGEPIGSIDFSAATKDDLYDGNSVKEINDYRSDFLIHEITFKTADYEYDLNITAAPGNGDGSESITSITVTVPAGAELSHGTKISGTNDWTLSLNSDGAYQVTINPDGSVNISGVTLTMPNDTPPSVTVTAVAQGDAVDGVTPPPASASDSDTAGAIDKTFENKITITDSDAVLEGGNLEFEVTLDSVVDNDTVLHFNFGKKINPNDAERADVDTPSVTINGVAHGPVVVHGDGSYSVTIPAGTQDIKITVPTIRDGVTEGNEDLTLNATLNGETKGGAELTNGGAAIEGSATGTIEDLQLINNSNIGTPAGFTVTAENGDVIAVPELNGFGVGNTTPDYWHDQIIGDEVIKFTFDKPVTDLTARLEWLAEGKEAIFIITYKDGTTETVTVQGTGISSDIFNIGDNNRGPIDKVAISAGSDSGFIINELGYKELNGDEIYGTNGDDNLTGTNADDIIVGDDGDDIINGGAGNDTLYGGAGDDTINGGADNDTIYGGAGNDKLYGDDGNDILYGGAGNDELYGGDGHDILYGEDGNDELYGGAGNDTLYGGAGDDILDGGAGNDVLYGGDGNDKLYGGTGADKLYGGLGDDIIDLSGAILGTGDGEVDIVYWTKAEAESGKTQNDTIKSFEVGTDLLDISGFLSNDEKGDLGNYLTAVDDGNGNTLVKVTSGTGAELNITLEGVSYAGDILDQILTADLVSQLP